MLRVDNWNLWPFQTDKDPLVSEPSERSRVGQSAVRVVLWLNNFEVCERLWSCERTLRGAALHVQHALLGPSRETTLPVDVRRAHFPRLPVRTELVGDT